MLDIKDNRGQFGLAVDVMHAIACMVADFRDIYFSSGTVGTASYT